MVLKFDGNRWSMMEPLLQTRWAHRSVVVEDTIIHVGGIGKQYFEKWIYGNNHFIQKRSTKYLEDYYIWPETFVVSEQFCKPELRV